MKLVLKIQVYLLVTCLFEVVEVHGWWLKKQDTELMMCNNRPNRLIGTLLHSFGKSPSNNVPYCSVSVDEMPAGREQPGSTFHDTPLPPWVNITLAQEGQRFGVKNKFGVTLAAVAGLILGLPIPDSKDVLVFTSNSDTRKKAIKRYVATGTQFLIWLDDVLKVDPKHNAFLTSISHVKKYHKDAAARVTAAPKPLYDPNRYANVETDDAMWEAILKDVTASKLEYKDWVPKFKKYDAVVKPVNQFIQGITLLQFVSFVIVDPPSTFIYDATDDDLRAYLHLWAVIGYVLGVDDDYNVCLRKDLADAKIYLHELTKRYLFPALFHFDKPAKVLIESVLKGYNDLVAGLGMRSIMLRILRDYVQIPVPHLQAILSVPEQLAQKRYDEEFLPSTRSPGTRFALNTALEAGLQAYVLANFGLQFTHLQKAQKVFYYPSDEL